MMKMMVIVRDGNREEEGRGEEMIPRIVTETRKEEEKPLFA